MQVIEKILKEYSCLLAEVDVWFNNCIKENLEVIVCGESCSGCCRGLFDITLLDAYYLKSGFGRLDASIKTTVLEKVKERLVFIQAVWPEYGHPYVLNYRPDDEWAEVMPEDDDIPCVLLGSDGNCLVYDYRPMTCRLHGVPLIDLSREIMDEEWCSLNFEGVDPFSIVGLRWELLKLFRDELFLFNCFIEQLLGERMNELDTFIPMALLQDFSEFELRKWLEKRFV